MAQISPYGIAAFIGLNDGIANDLNYSRRINGFARPGLCDSNFRRIQRLQFPYDRRLRFHVYRQHIPGREFRASQHPARNRTQDPTSVNDTVSPSTVWGRYLIEDNTFSGNSNDSDFTFRGQAFFEYNALKYLFRK